MYLPSNLSLLGQPSAFIEHLAKYRKSMDEIELREKQLAAMRVDVCSTVALKKLKGFSLYALNTVFNIIMLPFWSPYSYILYEIKI